jgi:L-asparaginase
MTQAAEGGIRPTLRAEDLMQAVPALSGIAEISAASPLQLPGASLTVPELVQVARLIESHLAGETDGVVLAQGTDTIEETAFLLDRLVHSDKPVVVTGAMRGPAMPGADGPANLLAAMTTAASTEAAGLGTLVVLNDEIHAARYVQKAHTALPSAFQSPLCGPLGLVVEGRVQMRTRVSRAPVLDLPSQPDIPDVALLRMALGDDGRMLGALVGLGYKGAVIEGMGAGHVPARVASALSDLVPLMPVVLCSRVHTGPVFTATYGFAGSEMDLLGRGLWPAGALSGLKARLLLTLILSLGASRGEAETLFRQHCAAV